MENLLRKKKTYFITAYIFLAVLLGRINWKKEVNHGESLKLSLIH